MRLRNRVSAVLFVVSAVLVQGVAQAGTVALAPPYVPLAPASTCGMVSGRCVNHAAATKDGGVRAIATAVGEACGQDTCHPLAGPGATSTARFATRHRISEAVSSVEYSVTLMNILATQYGSYAGVQLRIAVSHPGGCGSSSGFTAGGVNLPLTAPVTLMPSAVATGTMHCPGGADVLPGIATITVSVTALAPIGSAGTGAGSTTVTATSSRLNATV